MTQKRRAITYFDILRVLSIFIVIFSHTNEDGYFIFANYPTNSLQFWLYLFISIGGRFAIPVFFAISGALMLGRENESLKDLWRKKILTMAIIYLIISLLYYLERNLIHGDGLSAISVGEFFRILYCAVHETQLWYICEYITFLICLPFLRALVKSLEIKYYYYMLAIVSFFKFLPIIEYILWDGQLSLYYSFKITWLTADIVVFPLLGYFLHNYVTFEQIKKALIPTWIISMAATLLSCYATYKLGTASGQFSPSSSQFFFDYTNYLSFIAMFITFRYITSKNKIKDSINNFIGLLGKLTFGTYLFHYFFLRVELLKNMLYVLKEHMNEMLAVWIYVLVIMILSYTISFIISKIPLVKKLIRY